MTYTETVEYFSQHRFIITPGEFKTYTVHNIARTFIFVVFLVFKITSFTGHTRVMIVRGALYYGGLAVVIWLK